MTDTLLQTKLYRPPTRPQLVPRPRLIKKLNAGLNGKLTLVAAPAGFGKTTLIAHWLHQFQDQRTQTVWLSLDADDNAPQQFFSYLAAAIRPLPASQATLSQHLQAPQPLPAKTLAKAFVNDVVPVSTPFLLILDDFHFIQSAEINAAVTFLLDHMPPQMHLVITSRADPLLPLSRLRARQQLNEIRAADLRLTEAETAVFLNDLMQLNLSPVDIAALEARTEGWVAGLQLAALSLEKLADSAKHTFVTDLSGDDRYILDYLLDEVLRQQPPHIRDFLLTTSVLDRLYAPLCDFLIAFSALSNPQLKNLQSQQLLEQLDRANLFLVPLDNTRHWYRYHHLFGDLLTNQLQASNRAVIPQLHKQASRWFEANSMLAEAFGHAWKSSDFVYVVAFLKRHARELLVRAELVTLVSWLGKLPPEHLAAEPQLCIYYAWAATSLLQLETAVAALNLVDTFTKTAPLSAPELADWQGQTAVLRGLLATKSLDISQAISLSQQGLTLLLPDNHLLRGLAVSTLATTQWFIGSTAAAAETLAAAIEPNQMAGNISETINLYGMLAQSTFEMGQLQRTETICQAALQLILHDSRQQVQGRPLAAAGLIYVQLGQLYYEWNRLDAAAAYVQQGIELSQHESIGNLMMLRVLLATLHSSQGNEESALAELAKVQALTARMTLVQIMAQAADIEAFIHLQRGELTAVRQWIEAAQIRAEDSPSHFHEPRYLIFAHFLILEGRWAEAEKLLAVLRQQMLAGGRSGRLIHATVLTALAYQQQGQQAQATAVFQQALTLAEPAGFIRTFLNAGQPIAAVLATLKPANAKQQTYIQTLLDAFQGDSKNSATRTPHSALLEPLSERELEVLLLVANGRSNRQIADELYLAIGTVKKHISNIFGKLQVSSRTQAVARARELNLI